MTVEPNSSSGAGATPNAGSPATGTPPQSGATPPAAPSLTLEEALKRLADAEHARDNAASERDRHRGRLTELEAAEKKRAEGEMSELQKAQARAADLEKAQSESATELQRLRVETAVAREAAKMGIIDPDVAATLISGEVKYDAVGQPTNIDTLLAKLAKDKPYLVGKPASSNGGGATNPPRSAQSGGEMTDEEYKSLTPAQYEAQKGRVQTYLAKKRKY